MIPAAHYAISVDPQLATVTATLCAVSGVLPPLESRSRFPEKYTRQQAIPGKPGCRVVKAEIGRAAREEDDARRAKRSGDSLILSTDLFLFVPDGGWSEDTKLTASFELPAGISAATPWPELSAGTYTVPKNVFELQSMIALGRFVPWKWKLDQLHLEVALLGKESELQATPEGLKKWLRGAGSALLQLYGRTPVPKIMVLLLPVRGDEVEFGIVYRGGGPTALFYLGRNTADRALYGEWVAVHELSHFALPLVRREDAWLSEGIASYYQNILRARAGMITEEEAWEKLHAGFQRGLRDSGESTLQEAAERMHLDRRYMRVYWSGAAIALLADVALRTQGGSLDESLRSVQGEAAANERAFSAAELAKILDSRGKTAVFSRLFREHVSAEAFPDLSATYRELGLSFSGGRVRFDADAPRAALRKAIVAPKERR